MGLDGVGQDRVQQLDPRREVAVEGGDADAGAAGDPSSGAPRPASPNTCRAAAGQGVAVALGVAAQPPRRHPAGGVVRVVCRGHGQVYGAYGGMPPHYARVTKLIVAPVRALAL